MLNFDVKRKINTLRDILVGKVPDPKAQVEQITIALIFKFMDDMDIDSVSFGGNREFFKGEYEQYAFSQLMLPEHSAQQRLNLYAEGIEKITMNPDLPQLFRDIFRGAYIPYRDPETLNMFLKEIAEFSYSNSEDLGNAFEYLLSIMGSQGDAGQFRTPRHIIDMMVDITAPQKNESILDPACGTAGFLISAFKYIEAHNRDKSGISSLTADDKNRMVANFAGYDISPDMVRLSRVNMYLHGFSKPPISEYDTLTSLDKWDYNYDVIFANPPFMTPKGGIIPHNRYRNSARRSEVLFVDYIAAHLTPTGRAAVIVPEGIVFQSANAYKNLRKDLVDNGLLYAVISLPAGVFNPYSGVKTSILLMDKKLSKERDSILFVKLNNDGFDLGAQRREVKGNEIPDVVNVLKDYQKGVNVEERPNTIFAKKADIARQDYILVGERYKATVSINSKWPMVALEDIVDYEQPTNYIVNSVEYSDSYTTPVLTAGQSFILGYTNESCGVYTNPLPVIIFDDFTTATKFVDFAFKVKSSAMKILHANSNRLNAKYLFYAMQNIYFDRSIHKRYWISEYSKLRIPLPPLSVQKIIVTEIESYQKIIDGAKQVVDNYKPTVKIEPTWEMVNIGKMYDISYGVTISIPQNQDDNGIKIVSTAEVGLDGSLDLSNIRKVKYEPKYKKFVLEPNTLLFNWRNAPKHVGKTALFMASDDKYISASFLLSLKNKQPEKIDNRFIWCAINNLRATGYFMRNARQAVNQTNFNGSQLSETTLALPPIETQRKIVDRIIEEMTIMEQNKRLIEIFQQKIKDKIADVWGE